MLPREINKTLVVCICRRPICLQVIYGETIRVVCDCGNTIVQTFPGRSVADRKAQLRQLIDRQPANRWEAIGIELLLDELKELEKNT